MCGYEVAYGEDIGKWEVSVVLPHRHFHPEAWTEFIYAFAFRTACKARSRYKALLDKE